MPRDLVTVSQLIRETQTDLEHATTAVDNAKATLVKAEANQQTLIERFDALVEEHAEAVAAAKAKGLRQTDQTAIFSAGADFDAAARDALTDAFDRATTPQNGAAF